MRYNDQRRAGAIRKTTVGPRHIEVHYQDGKRYRYSHDSAGSGHVDSMKRLARLGVGLTGYIASNRPKHEGPV